MITVKPIEDNIRKEQLLSQYHCSAADSTILVMKDGVCELGYAAIDLIQGKLLIRNIFLTNGSAQELNAENKIYIDFLMRAAASYGANHGAYQMENCVEELHSFFVSKGFVLEHGICTIPISNCTSLQSASYLKERPKEVSFGLFLPFPLCIVAIDF